MECSAGLCCVDPRIANTVQSGHACRCGVPTGEDGTYEDNAGSNLLSLLEQLPQLGFRLTCTTENIPLFQEYCVNAFASQNLRTCARPKCNMPMLSHSLTPVVIFL